MCIRDSSIGRSFSVEVKSAVAAYNTSPGTVTIYNDATGANCTVPLVTRDTGGLDPTVDSGERRSLKAVSTLHWVKVENAGGTPICLLYTSDAADERSSVDLG